METGITISCKAASHWRLEGLHILGLYCLYGGYSFNVLLMITVFEYQFLLKQNLPYLCQPASCSVLWRRTFTKKTERGWERHAWHLPTLPWITDSLALFSMCTQPHERRKKNKKTMPHFSCGVVTRLVESYLLPFCKRCLSLVLVCSDIWSLLITTENGWVWDAQPCSSPQEGLVSLHGATDSLNPKHFDIIAVSRLHAMPACALRVCPPIQAQCSNRPPILSSPAQSQ